MILSKLDELTSISALLDNPNSIGIIPPGEVTTNFGKVYAKRPSKKFPYSISKQVGKKLKVKYINPKKNTIENQSRLIRLLGAVR